MLEISCTGSYTRTDQICNRQSKLFHSIMNFKSPLTILVPVLRVWKDNLRRIYTLRQCSQIDYQNMHCEISFSSVFEFTTKEDKIPYYFYEKL